MRFVFGFLMGIIVGMAAAVAYSVQTDRDLREEYAGARSDLSKRDFDALGARLESRVTEMQTLLETRVNQMREKAEEAAEAADAAVETPDASDGEEKTEA